MTSFNKSYENDFTTEKDIFLVIDQSDNELAKT